MLCNNFDICGSQHNFDPMKWICAFVLMFCVTHAQTVADCDSLIASGIREMQKGEHARSLEMLTRAASVSQERGWHKQHFLALNNIGANYYNMLDYGEALRHYLRRPPPGSLKAWMPGKTGPMCIRDTMSARRVFPIRPMGT